ncbi:MAG: MFS transporter [Alphaproteobacteria bacterium]|nr:MFS transporter [Alphaproteobacteria bacterium]
MNLKQSLLVEKRVIVASSLGNLLEMYSFSLFAMLLPTLTPLFFPLSDPFAALFLAYSVFSVGFLAYPLGALLFGYMGDRYGRRFALSLSLLGMALGTFCIGLLPSYATLGIISPFLLACFRFIQGICAGGECMGSGIFLIESTSAKNSGFFGSLVAASGTFGALYASIVSVIFVSSIMPSWAWRIPFIVSIFIGGVGLYLRSTLEESSSFKNSFSKTNYSPIKEVFRHHFIPLLCAVGIGALGTVPFYLTIGFLNSYLVFLNIITIQHSESLNFILLLFCVLTMPFVGYLADKVGHVKIMVLSALLSLMYAYPFFCIVYTDSFFTIVFAELLFLALSQLFVAPLNAFMSQLFPVRARYTGAAFGYCMGMALFGGTAPYISLSLINWLGTTRAPFLYVMFICLIGLISVRMGKGYLPSEQKEYKLIESEI